MDLSQTAPLAWRDPKRHTWWFSLLVPLFSASGSLLYWGTGQVWSIWLPVLISYAVFPFLDYALGSDESNPPESAVPALEADRFYRYLTFALVPMLWGAFAFNLWFYAAHDLPWHARLAGIIAMGMVGGYGINLGHELGHKRSPLERRLAQIMLALTGYGHFYVEHNRGHHRDVATPEDPASARMGESIWRFVWREMPGAWRRAWSLEAERLARCGKSVWNPDNQVLQPWALTLLFWGGMSVWLGWVALPIIALASFWSNFQLTSANYIEHYGLLRGRDDTGRYERCAPHHSWNSNFKFSNWVVFHLQRHSDHHANPLRRYQALRQFEGVPQLPSGYFSMFWIAWLTPWWFAVMNPRLIEAVGGDVARINFDPAKRDALIARYGLTPPPA